MKNKIIYTVNLILIFGLLTRCAPAPVSKESRVPTASTKAKSKIVSKEKQTITLKKPIDLKILPAFISNKNKNKGLTLYYVFSSLSRHLKADGNKLMLTLYTEPLVVLSEESNVPNKKRIDNLIFTKKDLNLEIRKKVNTLVRDRVCFQVMFTDKSGDDKSIWSLKGFIKQANQKNKKLFYQLGQSKLCTNAGVKINLKKHFEVVVKASNQRVEVSTFNFDFSQPIPAELEAKASPNLNDEFNNFLQTTAGEKYQHVVSDIGALVTAVNNNQASYIFKKLNLKKSKFTEKDRRTLAYLGTVIAEKRESRCPNKIMDHLFEIAYVTGDLTKTTKYGDYKFKYRLKCAAFAEKIFKWFPEKRSDIETAINNNLVAGFKYPTTIQEFEHALHYIKPFHLVFKRTVQGCKNKNDTDCLNLSVYKKNIKELKKTSLRWTKEYKGKGRKLARKIYKNLKKIK